MSESGYNYLGKYINPRCWTNEAIFCYLRGCTCKGCIHKKGFYSSEKPNARKNRCQMKATVLELVRKFGKPILKSKHKEEGIF